MRLWLGLLWLGGLCATAGATKPSEIAKKGAQADGEAAAAPTGEVAEGVRVVGDGGVWGLSLEDAQMILQIEAQRLPPQALRDYVQSPEAAHRARAARALGRLRTAEALSPLRLLAEAAEPEVRREAAFALGQTPGGGMVAQARLGVESDGAVRAALLEALSKQGSSAAVPFLTAALEERAGPLQSPDEAIAAALGLGRMARRGVEGVAAPEVVAALVAQLERLSPPLRQAAAYALAQIRPPSPPPEAAAAMLARLRPSVGDPEVRKQLLYATADFARSPEERDALYGPLVTDSSEDVRVALARVSGRVAWPGVAALLSDRALGVRLEAIAAVAQVPGLDQGRLLLPLLQQGGTLEADEALRTSGDPALLEAAAALAALGSSPVEGVPALLGNADAYLQARRPGRIRVAAAGVSTDTVRLAELARKDGEVAVRTAAALRLAELDPPARLMIGLLSDAFDAMVRAVAADWLADHPTSTAEAALLDALSDATDLDLITAACEALTALYEGSAPRVRRPDAAARERLAALAAHPDAQVQAARHALAEAMGLSDGSTSGVHTLITAPLDEVMAIRAARIQTSRGEAIVALYPAEAPVTVWNFAQLAESGFYNGLTIHRVVPDFVVQDGDPRGDGAGGPGHTIPDEINPLRHAEGALGMAHAGPDTGGSQWFVTLSDQPHLDGVHTVFGHVQRGQHLLRDLQPGDRIERILIERAP